MESLRTELSRTPPNTQHPSLNFPRTRPTARPIPQNKKRADTGPARFFHKGKSPLRKLHHHLPRRIAPIAGSAELTAFARLTAVIVVPDTNIIASATYCGANPRAVSKHGFSGSMNWPSAIPFSRSMRKLSPVSPFAIRQSNRQAGSVPSSNPGMFSTMTGDKGHLLSLKEARGIPMVAASDFLSLL